MASVLRLDISQADFPMLSFYVDMNLTKPCFCSLRALMSQSSSASYSTDLSQTGVCKPLSESVELDASIPFSNSALAVTLSCCLAGMRITTIDTDIDSLVFITPGKRHCLYSHRKPSIGHTQRILLSSLQVYTLAFIKRRASLAFNLVFMYNTSHQPESCIPVVKLQGC